MTSIAERIVGGMATADELRTLLPNARVTDRPTDIEPYRDIDGGNVPVVCVVLPSSYEDVRKVLRHCDERGLGVVPWGGGTNLCRALSPSRASVALDMKSLGRIIGFDEVTGTVTVQAGATPDDIDSYLAARGFRFHFDPWSRFSCTIGGALAMNANGSLYPVHGGVGDEVLSLRVALADGTMMDLGPGTRAASMPQLFRLFMGSEGTLGVILEATFAVYPVPPHHETVGCAFTSFSSMFDALLELERAGLSPDSFIGGTIPRVTAKLQPKAERVLIRALRIKAALFAYYEGDIDGSTARVAASKEILSRAGKLMPQKYSEEWWPNRHTYFESNEGLVNEGLSPHVFDLAVPEREVPGLVARVEELMEKAGFADRLSHTLFTSTDAYTVSLFLTAEELGSHRISTLSRELFELVWQSGGTVSRTHGYGTLIDHQAVQRDMGDDLGMLGRLKKVLDPNGTLNPGVMLPDRTEVDGGQGAGPRTRTGGGRVRGPFASTGGD